MAVDAARVKSLFLAAADLADPAERAAYLERECGGDAELRARVEALLRANDAAPLPEPGHAHATGPAVPDAPAAVATATYRGPHEQAGVVIAGKYTLVELIGEGGMGSVWRAKQTEPVKRFVAVKLIKAGLDSLQVLARFEAERQALALMDHPNIAKVFDGGLHEQRPFFIMELVKGVPITDYSDQCKLTPKERLELFVPVCQAIQHAHQKGIIHRDIKPSNVLIALYDDKPVVKVIDFGVAKATGGTLTEYTIDTGFGAVVGTPQYMSPEQATFNNLDIDTRSDVYALGVLLYELLAGSPPFARKELEKHGLLEILRVVREEEPPRPSVKLRTAEALPTLSANRGTEPKKLTGLLRNELDWIVMKALEKDRMRRYETANGFAADVQRYLNGEAVQAHPPSTAYRLRKFVRRNRGRVLAASLVLLALLVGIAGTTWGLIEARRQEAEARRQAGIAHEEAQAREQARAAEAEQRSAAETAAEAEKAANARAQKRLWQIEKGNEIITLIFTDLDIRHVKKGTEPLEAVLAQRLVKAAAQLEGEAVGDPLAVAHLQNQLGRSLVSLGYPQEAIGLFVKARQTFTTRRGPHYPGTLTSMYNLGMAYEEAGKLDLALPLMEETLKLTRAKLGAEHPLTLDSMNNLASAYQVAGKRDLALPLCEETLKLRKAKQGAEHHDTLVSALNLALAYKQAGKLDLALPLLEDTLKLFKASLGGDHPDTLNCMNTLASSYQDAGKRDLALPLWEETLKLFKRKLGADHPDTLTCMGNLALAYEEAGKRDLALPLVEETLKLRKVKQGADHPSTLASMNNLAAAYVGAGKFDLALSLFEETLNLTRAKLGADHPSTLICINNLAAAYQVAGKLDLALPLCEETLKLTRAKQGADHPDTLTSMNNLAGAYLDAGKLDLALPRCEETLKLTRATLGANHPLTLASMSGLARAYLDAGKLDLALPLCEETLKLTRATLGADHPQTLLSMNALAQAYQDAGKLALALPLFEETLKLRKAKLGAEHPQTLASMSNLAGAYLDARKLDLALPLCEETLKFRKAKLGAEHPDTLKSMNTLAQVYKVAGKLDLALPLFEQTLKLMKAKLGAEHPLALSCMNNLAGAYHAAGKQDLALPLLEETLELRKVKLGLDHPDTLTSMNNLAVEYWQLKRLDQSIPLFEETLKLREKKLGRQHLKTLQTVANLGVNYKDAGRLKEAIALLEEAYAASQKLPPLRGVASALLDAYLKVGQPTEKAKRFLSDMLADARGQLPRDSPQLAETLARVGLFLLQVKAFAEAEPLLRECLAIRDKTMPDSWLTFNTQSLLGGALLGQKKYAEAEPLLLKGSEAMKVRELTIPRGGEARIPEALDRLIELYMATNKPDEVKKWQTERAKYPEAKKPETKK